MNINFTKFVPISEFVPYVRTAIDGIDEDMALVYITNAIIEFCKDSRILKYTQCIELQPCVDSYILDVPAGSGHIIYVEDVPIYVHAIGYTNVSRITP